MNKALFLFLPVKDLKDIQKFLGMGALQVTPFLIERNIPQIHSCSTVYSNPIIPHIQQTVYCSHQ